MSLKIRLSRTGKHGQKTYRIVLAEERSKRDGESIEVIGFYNPTRKPVELTFDKKRYEELIKQGARPTKTVDSLVKKDNK